MRKSSRGIAVLVMGLILMFILTGCGEPKVDDGPPKKVINTYLEGFRDKNPEKIYNTVSYETYRELRFPGQLESLFKAQDNQVGKIEAWSFMGESYIDEVNNQALIQALIKASKHTFVLEFDVRRLGDKWYIFGLEQKNTEKKSKPK